jgi:hypothetical protein
MRNGVSTVLITVINYSGKLSTGQGGWTNQATNSWIVAIEQRWIEVAALARYLAILVCIRGVSSEMQWVPIEIAGAQKILRGSMLRRKQPDGRYGWQRWGNE